MGWASFRGQFRGFCSLLFLYVLLISIIYPEESVQNEARKEEEVCVATRLLGLAAETQLWLPKWKEQQALSSEALLFLIPREKQRSDMGGGGQTNLVEPKCLREMMPC